jgi:UDP-N-acetylglucosamine/UDP-N-acetylgalactosamine diphosphorylase
MSKLEDVVEVLDGCGQSHIYKTLDKFDSNHPIFHQLAELNIERSVSHFATANLGDISKSNDPFTPASNVVNLAEISDERRNTLVSAGYDAVRMGKVAAVIMSGGQGTRLGYAGPKGMYNLGMPSHKTIFQMHIEKIVKINLLAGNMDFVPVYIMTSNLNHSIIVQYFAEHNYFGYPADRVVFFEQGVEPSFTFDGKIIIESAESLSLAPDGNGGIYRALQYSGCIDDMLRRGVEHLHIYGIDNVLTKSLDPLFIGACIANQVECGNKVVWRAHKTEKVGVTAELNGRMHVLEYSELPTDLADSEDAEGKLLFGAANICNHYLSVSFLQQRVLPSLSEVYHVAKKKIPYYDPVTKQTVTPDEVNGVKMEMFIFDVFPLATRWLVVEGCRGDEFAPVKNAPGTLQVN